MCVANTIIFVMNGKFESSLAGVEYSADGECNVIGSLEVGRDSVAVAGLSSCLYVGCRFIIVVFLRRGELLV